MNNNEQDIFLSGLQCIALLGKFHQINVNTDELYTKYNHQKMTELALTETQLLRAAKSTGFKAKFISIDIDNINEHSLPAIAQKKDGRFSIIAKINDKGVLIHDLSISNAPEVISFHDFEQSFTHSFLFLSPRKQALSEKAKFGIKWFVPAVKKYKKLFIEVLVASFFIQLFGLASPIFFQVAIDKVMVHNGLTTLNVLATGFFCVILFEVLLSAIRAFLFSHTTNRIDVGLGSEIYQHMLKLPLAYFKSRRVGDTVARIKELDSIREFMTGTSLTLILDLLFTFVFFAVMFYYSSDLTWIVVASLPFYFVIAYLLGPSIRSTLEKKFKHSAENHSYLVESVHGVETIKSMAVEHTMGNKWDEKLAQYTNVSFKAFQLNNLYSQTSNFITKTVGLLILYFGSLAVTEGTLTIGQFIAFNILAQRIAAPIMRFASVWQDFQQAKISIERLGDVLNTPTESGTNSKLELPKLRGEVIFEHTCFSYSPERANVLNDINLKVSAGEVIGLVGRSGSGKSSLTKLVQRLYLPNSGRIYIDGVDINLINPAWLRPRVGVVLQENFLFSGTIRENIALSDPSASLERVIEAAQLAGAEEFILKLPEAYDTQVGEQGSALSGGQRQRLAIARALLSNPAILIFDEATSALDYESERIIQQNMQKIAKGRTVFIVAHRLSAVRDADRILVLDNGRIVEQGAHKHLLKLEGIYAHLASLQDNTVAQSKTPKRANVS
ncbi:type I secretion system permease/ATPase [Pseudoalteromonas rubra]|uniref:Type I secretion system permease/ATPase n=1 Tax=Pseudoalteromonas rubra TaxID=43658 RepID=A0A5S3X6S7_9GAMM|nr:type I secretion system permease/ATPase [Pseudoalteromonas rubra]TMP39817.1 type I secretion system permease/ATPase [Pseudoalteromonas rubra]